MVKFKSYDVNILSTTATADGGYDSRATSSAVQRGGHFVCPNSARMLGRPLGRRHLAAKSFGTVPCDRRNVRRRETIRVSKQSSMGVSKGHVPQNATNVLCDGSLRESRPHEKYWLLRFHVSTRGSPGVTIESVLNVAVLQAFFGGRFQRERGQIHQAWGWHARAHHQSGERGILLVVQKQPQATKHEIVWEAGQSGGVHPVQVMYESNDGVGALIQRAQGMAAEVRQMKKMAAETERTVAADEVIDKIKAENIEHLDEIAKTEVSRLLEALADPERRASLLRQSAGVFGYADRMHNIRKRSDKRKQKQREAEIKERERVTGRRSRAKRGCPQTGRKGEGETGKGRGACKRGCPQTGGERKGEARKGGKTCSGTRRAQRGAREARRGGKA